MKFKLLSTLLILSTAGFTNFASAAVCSCDAPPECGEPPSVCFRLEARNLDARTYIEKDATYPRSLTLEPEMRDGIMQANYGGALDGNPGGTFIAIMTSPTSFKLVLTSSLDGSTSVVDRFELVRSEGTGTVLKRLSDGREFLSLPSTFDPSHVESYGAINPVHELVRIIHAKEISAQLVGYAKPCCSVCNPNCTGKGLPACPIHSCH